MTQKPKKEGGREDSKALLAEKPLAKGVTCPSRSQPQHQDGALGLARSGSYLLCCPQEWALGLLPEGKGRKYSSERLSNPPRSHSMP